MVRSLAADLDQLGLQVTPANVLQVRNALRGETERLGQLLVRYDGALPVQPHAADPVSVAAAPLFNEKIAALRQQCQGYVDALSQAGLELERTAREYGQAEQQIQQSFDSYLRGLRPLWREQARERDEVQALPQPLRSMVLPRPPDPPRALFPPGTAAGPSVIDKTSTQTR